MTLRAFSFFISTLALLLASGCGDDAMPDAGPGGARIEIGTGDIGDYEEFTGQALLVRGSQGGQHVWVGLRAWDLDTRPALIQLILERDSDGEVVSIPFQVRLTFQDDVPMDADYTQISGLALVVPDADDVLGEEITVRARVSENRTGGTMAESAVMALVADWDPDNPPGFRPGEDGGVPDGGGFDDGGADAGDAGGDAGDADAGDGGVMDATPDA